MSTAYYVYAEIQVDGKWYNLSPTMKRPDGTFSVEPIYWAQSSFFDVYNDLESHSIGWGIPDDMSKDMLTVFHENLDEVIEGWGKMTWREHYRQSVFVVPYASSVADKIVKDRPFKYEGYVHKRSIADFECGEIDCLFPWLTIDEYNALPKEEQIEYSFYRWNEYGDDYYFYSIIAKHVSSMMYWFDFGNAFEDRNKWYGELSDSMVRLIIERC